MILPIHFILCKIEMLEYVLLRKFHEAKCFPVFLIIKDGYLLFYIIKLA